MGQNRLSRLQIYKRVENRMEMNAGKDRVQKSAAPDGVQREEYRLQWRVGEYGIKRDSEFEERKWSEKKNSVYSCVCVCARA